MTIKFFEKNKSPVIRELINMPVTLIERLPHQMEGESDKAYRAFVLYALQGPFFRGTRKVNDVLGAQSSFVWSSKYAWTDRAWQFDFAMAKALRDKPHMSHIVGNLLCGNLVPLSSSDLERLEPRPALPEDEKPARVKLCEEDVRYIRESSEKAKDLAELFNVSEVTIYQIRLKQTHKEDSAE